MSTPFYIMAQDVATKSNLSKDAPVTDAPVTLVELNKAFIVRAKMRIADNEKSVLVLKATQNIKDNTERAYYNERVLLFEKRNMEMNNKIYEFNVVSGTIAEFNEFKKRWHWAMDELSIYEKNLMTENFLNK